MNSRRRPLLALCLLACVVPLAGRAEPADRVRRIGVLSLNKAGSQVAQFEAAVVLVGLRGAGFWEGRNLQLEWRYAEADVARLAGLAEQLVRLEVELILAITNDPIEAAMRATRRIPIVMIGAALPVELGYVQSLARSADRIPLSRS